MIRIRTEVWVAAVVAGVVALAQPARLLAQDDQGKKDEAARLIGVLQSSTSEFDKAKACQKLAVIGTKEAVPALAALLSDEKLGHYARFGLEPIPDPAVDGALRDAMGRLKGHLLVGVINSIGQRKDPKAVEGVTARLGDSDPEVAAAAAAALGRIATPEAVQALQQALASPPDGIRAAVGDAGLACAEQLLGQGKREEAVAMCDRLRQADLPKHQLLAATRGAILARQSDGLSLLVECLRSQDPRIFGVALRAARELPGGEQVTGSLVAELGKLPEDRRALLIQALVDRGDAAALPVVLDAARGGPLRVRATAIRLLGRFGDASALPVLLEAAVGSEVELAEAAQASLARLRSKEVDAALQGMLDDQDRNTRRVVIEVVGQRGVASAVPALRKAADDPDQEIRLVAIRALGRTVGLQDLPALVHRVIAPKNPEELAAARDALKTACLRMPDRDACAEQLLAAMPQAPVAAQRDLLGVLGSVGGTKALRAVVAAAKGADEDLQDAATEALGKWPTPDAAADLLDLAKNLRNEKYKVRALSGYIRIARQFNVPTAERLAMCREAMAVAWRDDEKKRVIEVLGRNPSAESLAMVVPHLGNPGLKDDASAVAVSIAERIIQAEPAAVAAAMEQVIQATGNADLAGRAKALLERASRRTR